MLQSPACRDELERFLEREALRNRNDRRATKQLYCVKIAQGRLDLERCDITSQSLRAWRSALGLTPRVRGNGIHGGKADGVFIYDGAQGTIEDDEGFDNAPDCIVKVARTGNQE